MDVDGVQSFAVYMLYCANSAKIILLWRGTSISHTQLVPIIPPSMIRHPPGPLIIVVHTFGFYIYSYCIINFVYNDIIM